jgi:hypothetical protein
MNTISAILGKKFSAFSVSVLLLTCVTYGQIQNFSTARMVNGSTTEQVLDMTISLHRAWADLTPELRAQYEEVIGHCADAVYEMSNGGHLLGKIRIFCDSKFNNAADVIWEANLHPNSHLNGFTTSSNRRIAMADVFSGYDISGDAVDRQEAGYTLAHEIGHYVYSLFDEYVINAGDVAVVPSVMNYQWSAPVANFQWLNFSTSNNIGDVTKTMQGRYYGISAWDLLVQDPTLDPSAALLYTGTTRIQYPVLNDRAPTAANTWIAPNGTNYTWMSVQLPATRARDSLRVIWMGSTIDIDLVLDKSGSMTGTPIEDVKIASKAFIEALLRFSTNMQLTPSIGLTAFATVPDNPSTYPMTILTSANIGMINDKIDAMTASGNTAMYDACLVSNDKLTSYSGSNSTRICMLLTDGEENYSVVTNPQQVINAFVDENIPIYTFGYGSGASHSNCIELSEGTQGTFYANLTDIGEITDEWLRIFDNAADIQYAKDASFNVDAGLDFVIDPSVSACVVQVIYGLTSASATCTFTITDNNNAIVPTTVHIIPLGSSFPREEIALISIDREAIDAASAGNWKCNVTASGLTSMELNGTVKLKGKETGTYSLTITDFGKGNYTYPQPMHLTAAVGNSGLISGINVVAQLISPSEAISDIPMYDDGTNGDGVANDGIYTAVYSGYTENGQYQFKVNVNNASGMGYYAVEGVEYAIDQSGVNVKPDIMPVDHNFTREARTIIHVTGYDHSVIDQIMGFEDVSKWQFVFGTSGTLSNSDVVTGGSLSLQVEGNGWQQIKSVDINTEELPAITNKLAFDLFIGNNQPEQYWIGQVQLYINCPSANIDNQFIGIGELTGHPLGQFSTFTFDLPANIIDVMNGNHSDMSFSIAINTNYGSGPYYFDSLRFVP